MQVKLTKTQFASLIAEYTKAVNLEWKENMPNYIILEATAIPDTECEHKMTVGLSVPNYCVKCNYVPDTEECYFCKESDNGKCTKHHKYKQKESPKIDYVSDEEQKDIEERYGEPSPNLPKEIGLEDWKDHKTPTLGIDYLGRAVTNKIIRYLRARE